MQQTTNNKQIILWDSIDELQKETLGSSNGRNSNGKSNGFDPEQTALQLLSAHKRAVKVLKLCDTAILHISTLHPNGANSSGYNVKTPAVVYLIHKSSSSSANVHMYSNAELTCGTYLCAVSCTVTTDD
eukprot:14445-Heterococcus_DN1.PRE.2